MLSNSDDSNSVLQLDINLKDLYYPVFHNLSCDGEWS